MSCNNFLKKSKGFFFHKFPNFLLKQETRKIVGAQMQHITYNEWLPIVLGMEFMEENELLPLKEGLSNSYDPGVDPVRFNLAHYLRKKIIKLFEFIFRA